MVIMGGFENERVVHEYLPTLLELITTNRGERTNVIRSVVVFFYLINSHVDLSLCADA